MTTQAQAGRPHGIRSLDAVLTAACNLKCSYCYQNERKSPGMSWEVLRAAIDLVLDSQHRQVDLNFYGGEPLLELPLIRRAIGYAERNRSGGPRIRYGLTTNGTLMSPSVASFLARHQVRTQLSFDGVAAQELRGKGTFAQLDRLLDYLREEHPWFLRRSLSVNMTLTPATVPELASGFRYFLGKGIKKIDVTPVTHAPDWEVERIDQLDRQFGEVFEQSLRHYEETREVPLILFRRFEGESRERTPTRRMCDAGRADSVAVDADGLTYGCVMFAESYQSFPSRLLAEQLEPLGIGDVRAPDFEQKLADFPAVARGAEILNHKENKFSSYGRCDGCRYFADCVVCPASIGHSSSNTDPDRVPDFGCAYSLVSCKYREAFPAQRHPHEIFGRRLGRRRPLDARTRTTASAATPSAL